MNVSDIIKELQLCDKDAEIFISASQKHKEEKDLWYIPVVEIVEDKVLIAIASANFAAPNDKRSVATDAS